jgi:phosphopantothenate-cysteine ligase
MVVSFKLETDETLLLQKAQAALDGTAVACVVANLLDSRHTEVRVLPRQGEALVLRAAEGGSSADLEAQLASALVAMHAAR